MYDRMCHSLFEFGGKNRKNRETVAVRLKSSLKNGLYSTLLHSVFMHHEGVRIQQKQRYWAEPERYLPCVMPEL